MRSMSFAVRMPPDALTWHRPSSVSFISRTASTLAPPVEKPVEVLTKAAPASAQIMQARAISSLLSRQVSRITLTGWPAQACTTASISRRTASACPAFSSPMFITMSISSAPDRIASAASNALAAVLIAPEGKPATQHTLIPVPFSCSAQVLAQ